MKRLLIAGVGNIFLGDDGFGVEVVRRLGERALPEDIADDVELADFGIGAIDLGYALDDGYEAVIVVDAMPRGGAPGSLYVVEPSGGAPGEGDGGMVTTPHDLDPTSVLHMARGAARMHVVVVGCEPESFGTENDGEGRIGLSGPVAAAVEQAARLVESLAVRLLRGEPQQSSLRTHSSAGVMQLDGG